MIVTVPCTYPAQEDHPSGLPEGYDEWRDPSGRCTHDHCIEGDRMSRLYARTPRMTPDELAEMNADRELVLDETGGRGF